MLESKYSAVVWYCDNLGGFDYHFVINTLLRYNVKITNEDEKPFLVYYPLYLFHPFGQSFPL